MASISLHNYGGKRPQQAGKSADPAGLPGTAGTFVYSADPVLSFLLDDPILLLIINKSYDKL